jgi:hypothetical protein
VYIIQQAQQQHKVAASAKRKDNAKATLRPMMAPSGPEIKNSQCQKRHKYPIYDIFIIILL